MSNTTSRWTRTHTIWALILLSLSPGVMEPQHGRDRKGQVSMGEHELALAMTEHVLNEIRHFTSR